MTFMPGSPPPRTARRSAAIRASRLIVLQRRFGLSERAVPHARWHGQVLDATLTQVIDHFREHFFDCPARPEEDAPAEEAALDQRIGELRRAAGQVAGVAVDEDVDREAFADLLARSNSFLAELERRHVYGYEPL